MSYLYAALGLAATLGVQIGLVIVGFGIERWRPVLAPDTKSLRLNLAYIASMRLIYGVLYPVSTALTILLVNAVGGGLITLPDSGIGLAFAIPCYALAMDGGEYLFHRTQHRIPLLWAMHTLHHSDRAVNVSTAPRHFWGELLLKSISIYALLGLVFKANPVVVGAYAGLGLYNYFLHMNLRVGFGRWSSWLNSPQFHRLHHSALPEHYDCNFSQFFPVFDLLFGTYRQPAADEYPPTGLISGATPVNLAEMLLWPWRRHQSIVQNIVSLR